MREGEGDESKGISGLSDPGTRMMGVSLPEMGALPRLRQGRRCICFHFVSVLRKAFENFEGIGEINGGVIPLEFITRERASGRGGGTRAVPYEILRSVC